MNEDKYRDVTMTALPLFWVPFTQFRSAKQWWIVFILEVYHVRNGRAMWYPAVTIHACRQNSMRLLLHVTPDNEDRFLNSAITSKLNLALNCGAFFQPLSWKAWRRSVVLRMRLMTRSDADMDTGWKQEMNLELVSKTICLLPLTSF